MRKNDLIADALEIGTKDLMRKFGVAVEKDRFYEADKLLTRIKEKVYDITSDLWWNDVITFDDMLRVRHSFSVYNEKKRKQLYRFFHKPYSASSRRRSSNHHDNNAFIMMQQQINDMNNIVELNRQQMQQQQDIIQQQQNLMQQDMLNQQMIMNQTMF